MPEADVVERAEPSNDELLAKYPNATSRAAALAQWDKDQAAAESQKAEADFHEAKVGKEPDHEVERRERRAKLAAHPHTQLRAILSDMRTPAAQSSDINTKFAMLHSSVSRLAQLILGATPPPDDSEESINEDFERQQRHVEGIDEPEPGSGGQQHEVGQNQRRQ